MDSTSNQTSNASVSPNRSDVLALFKELRQMNNDYNPSNDKLIQLLGGIDAVMETVLNAPHHNISDAHCIALQQYLKEPLPPSNNDKLKWTLDPQNNKLHQISPFVHRHLFSKPVLAVLFFFWLFTTIVCLFVHWFYYFVIPLLWLIFIPFYIATLLRVNMTMMWRIAETADFWIMMASAGMFVIYFGIAQFYIVSYSYNYSLTVQILGYCSLAIFTFLYVIVICCMDGIEGINPKFKIFTMVLSSVVGAVASFLFGFVYEEHVIVVDELGEYGRISITGNLSNYYQILAIFFAKMAVNKIKKGPNRCVLVKYSPFIEWAAEPTQQSLLSRKEAVEDRKEMTQHTVELQETQDTEN